MKTLLVFLLYTVLMIFGQLCFANASKGAANGIISVFTSTSFWLAVTIYGFASVAWVLLLRTMPLSIAYPTAAAVTSIFLYIWFMATGNGAGSMKINEFTGIIMLLVGLFLIYLKR